MKRHMCAFVLMARVPGACAQAEGVELMWLMLANKRQSRYGALKLLDYATTRYSAPCEKLVDLGGLKHLFGAFMGKARIKGPTGGCCWEHLCSEPGAPFWGRQWCCSCCAALTPPPCRPGPPAGWPPLPAGPHTGPPCRQAPA